MTLETIGYRAWTQRLRPSWLACWPIARTGVLLVVRRKIFWILLGLALINFLFFFALIYLRHNGEELTLDSRPSDAIALALRAEAPIFVMPEVLHNAKSLDMADSLEDEDRLKKWLEDVDPEELGKYKM